MRAIVLAAGEGTRLRPLTNEVPKCMVPLLGRPLLQRQLDVLRNIGVDDITVIGGYRVERIDIAGVRVLENREFQSSNMVTTLFHAADKFDGAEDVLITYGDIVYERRVLDVIIACDAPVCVAADLGWRSYWEVRMEDPLTDAETFKVDRIGRVRELGRKPSGYQEIQAQYMGIIKVRADHSRALVEHYAKLERSVEYDGKDFDNMYMTSFIQSLIDTGWEVLPAFTENGWLEVDTVNDLRTYEDLARDGVLIKFYDPDR